MAQGQRTNPNPPSPTPAPPAPPKAEGAPTWTWLLLILVVLLIVGKSVISNVFTGSGGNTIATTAMPAIDTLGCSTDAFIEPRFGTTHYVVMPNKCWTNVIYRPLVNGKRTRAFFAMPKGRIMIQLGYGGNEWEEPLEADPGGKAPFKVDEITTMRFMNTSTQPIIVDITVS